LARNRCSAAAIKGEIEITCIVAVNLSGFTVWLPQDTLFPRTFRRVDGRQWAARHNLRGPQKVGQLRMPRAVFEGSERHVASGEVSDVMEVLPYESCPGDSDRGGDHSHGTMMNMK
jgi:hypothetical protein